MWCRIQYIWNNNYFIINISISQCKIDGVPRGRAPVGPNPSIVYVFPLFDLVLHENSMGYKLFGTAWTFRTFFTLVSHPVFTLFIFDFLPHSSALHFFHTLFTLFITFPIFRFCLGINS